MGLSLQDSLQSSLFVGLVAFEIMDWMAFYYRRRLHANLSYLSPMQCKQRWYGTQRKKAA